MMKQLTYIFLLFIPINMMGQNFEWARQFAGSSPNESYSVATDQAGNVFTTGYFYGTVDFDPGIDSVKLSAAGNGSLYVSKLNSAGEFVWVKQMDGPGDETAYDIALDATGNIFITGYFNGSPDFDPGQDEFLLVSNGRANTFVLKLDPAGDFVWAKQFSGFLNNIGRSIATSPSGEVYISGLFYGTVDFGGSTQTAGAEDEELYVVKLDAEGNFLWVSVVDGSVNSQRSPSIAVDGEGNAFMTGYFAGTVDFDPGEGVHTITALAQWDIFVLRLDNSGNFVWAKRFGGRDQSAYANSIALDQEGNIFTTGVFGGTVDFDPDSIEVSNLSARGNHDIFVSKLNVDGEFIWARRMGGDIDDEGYAIATDSEGNVYTTGYFEGTADFDPSESVYELTAASKGSFGSYDIFVSKLSRDGDFGWAIQMGGYDDDFGNGIATDLFDNVYTTGRFLDSADFDPGPGKLIFFAEGFSGSPDAFVHKVSQGSLGINPLVSKPQMIVYPNPAHSLIQVQTTEVIEWVNIFAIDGTLVLSSSLTAISIESLPPGVYLLQFRTRSSTGNVKFMKQ